MLSQFHLIKLLPFERAFTKYTFSVITISSKPLQLNWENYIQTIDKTKQKYYNTFKDYYLKNKLNFDAIQHKLYNIPLFSDNTIMLLDYIDFNNFYYAIKGKELWKKN